jgi:monovalent cation/hydrogen antiporter
MEALEQVLGLFLAAVLLAAAARRAGAPYPVFLALGGALLAFIPGAPTLTVRPDLALALFIAPVLLDAAFDASPRDLRDNWAPVAGLVVVAVGLTTLAAAAVARALVPDLPWAPAIVLGAVVAPPDAAAATAVLRHLRPPRRLLTILEGESLLNDASALLIYRVAVTAAVAHEGFTLGSVAPTFLIAVAGSVVVGPVLGWLTLQTTSRVQHVPSAIILQFVTTFGVWILAEHIGLSAVLTMVAYAITVARRAPERIPARARIPSYAVWDTAVFALNILAFVFIGLQIRPILAGLEPGVRGRYLLVAGAVLITVVVVRIAWHMSFNAAVRWRDRIYGFNPPRPMLRASVGSGVVISWAGMRGIVSLAAALALPAGFPYRDLILLTAFAVVLGTLIIQGLTLGPLLRWLALEDGDPVGQERRVGRARALAAALASLADDRSAEADAVRQEITSHLGHEDVHDDSAGAAPTEHSRVHRQALDAARQAVIAMRGNDEIGDDAFHEIEEELDWLEMADGNQGK